MRRPKKQEVKVQSVEDFWPPKWFFTYSDMATLLMTFFMVLATMVALKIPTVISIGDQKDEIPLTARELKRLAMMTGAKMKTDKMATVLKKVKKEDLEAITKIDEVAQLYENLKELITKKNLSEKINIERLGGDVSMNIPSSIVFSSGSYGLSKEAKEISDFIAEFVRENPCKMIIEGHTDNQPIHAPEALSNWELSIARANSFMRYLVEIKGLATDLIEAIGYGEHKPIASNDTPQGRARNREPVIIFTPHS